MKPTERVPTATRDFGAKAVNRLAKRGVLFTGLQAFPGKGPMPWANAERGYKIDDNGTGRVLSYKGVIALINGEI